MTDFGPCATWPVRWPCDVSCESPTATGRAADAATEILWALSGRQFDNCQVTLRPCRADCSTYPFGDYTPWPGLGASYPMPALIGGLWFNLICGSCGEGCSCTALSQVRLPAPVSSIVTVKVDGAPLATGGYRLDDNRLLVRLGGGEWPRCNDLTLADTEAGTWSVTAIYGQPVPESGQWAVGELACELLKAMNGEDCRLPQRVTQLARQGVTIAFPDVSELLTEGRTGLFMVDMFLTAHNPSRLRRRAGVYRVDGSPPTRAGV